MALKNEVADTIIENKSKSSKEQAKKKFIQDLKTHKDFASNKSGATILINDKSIKNANSILSKSNDEYLMIPKCNSEMPEHSLIIHLSEEVTVEHILADNHEEFSANLEQITFYGSSDYPPKNNKWKLIGLINP